MTTFAPKDNNKLYTLILITKMAGTTTIPQQTQDVNITISLSDISVLKDIKKTLRLFRGVEKVKASVPKAETHKLTGIEQALLDSKEGRVTKWENIDQMFNTLMVQD